MTLPENSVDSAGEDQNSDDGLELDGATQGQPASTVREQRRAQKALFESWLTSEAGQKAITTKAKNESGKDISNAADEELSIQSLMQRQGETIIKNPRDYQLELLERAKTRNTIAVLDTGSGKTLIAVMLIRWMIDQELELRASGNAPKITFFLVASVTLVFQQFSVLDTNLDHPITRISGADKADNWDKNKWKKLLEDNKVIICTADILQQALSLSFVKMSQINLLVFDEAHHAKKNHAYARIIKDFYIAIPDPECKPRVFGMTASPIDAKTDVIQAASELESLLDSKIATTTDMSFQDAVKRPDENVLRYNALRKPFETDLLRATKVQFGHITVFKKVFDACPNIARELGSWCADHHLVDKLSKNHLRHYEDKVHRRFYERRVDQQVEVLDAALAELQAAADFVSKSPLRVSNIDTTSMSSKVVDLCQFLRLQYERETTNKCIVFIEQRHNARLLAALLQEKGTQHLKSTFLIGVNNDSSEASFTFREQVVTLMKFRHDEYNCLLATSVAEEGLDVPDCNLVIRFDMYRTMIQYVQSRGRARQRNSKFIHMIETGNQVHQELLSEVRFQEASMRRFCQTLPEDRRLFGTEDSLEAVMSKEKGLRVYTEPTTGAKLTYGKALAYINHFVDAIPNPTNEEMYPTYNVKSTGLKFQAEVILPASAPINSAEGRVCTKKSLAKRSAAFEMCLKLRQKSYMNEHFMPTYEKKLRVMANAMLAVDPEKNKQYKMRIKPDIWATTRGSLPQELWMTVIEFPDGLNRTCQPLVLLTRTKLPQFPTFPTYLQNGQIARVRTRRIAKPLPVDDRVLEQISTFTWRIFLDVFSKKYETDNAQLSYWLVPFRVVAGDCTEGDPTDIIDWPLLCEVAKHDRYKWTPETPHDFLRDKFLVDIGDGSRKFFSLSVDQDKKPQDAVPEGAVKYKHMESILGYSVSLFKKSRAKAIWEPDQPVVKAEKILIRRNLLATPEQKERKENTVAYLCPEPLRISALTPAVATSCFVWPAIIYRLEAYLIALDACSLVGIECPTDLALAAVTKDSDNSGEHDSVEKVNFQKGMGENYERLEFIGDTFLKTATTISTFIQNPDDDEYEFHVKRMGMLCNKNLLHNALKLKLYEFVRSQAFSRRFWYPEGLNLLEGKGAKKPDEPKGNQTDTNSKDLIVTETTNEADKVNTSEKVRSKEDQGPTHPLGDKTIADMCEALIGAAFMTHDKPDEKWHESHWDSAVRTVTKLVGNEGHRMHVWNDYRVAYKKPKYQTGDVTAAHRDLALKVEKEHPYHFKYPRLLRSAFAHPSESVMAEGVPNYQRLEFLGDALLDQASISYLFNRFPDKDPQWLTEHKMAMVSNKFLGAVCVNMGFHKHLRYSTSLLEPQIREYVAQLLEAKRTSSGARDYWTTVSDPPKCLPDIIESYVGAMFVDSDFDYQTVRDFFERNVKWYFEDMSIYDTFANNHPCTQLHNLLQTTYDCTDYRLMARELPTTDGVEMERKDVIAAVLVHKEIVAHSKGKSGRYARVRVAKDAIQMLEGLAPFEFRARFGCECRVAEADGKKEVSVDCSL